MRVKKRRPSATSALFARVCVEMGRGRITEARIDDADSWQTDGYVCGGHITINPMHETVDTVIHELLHRLYPAWSERGVRIWTGRIMRQLSGAEVQAFYDEYAITARKRKSVKVVGLE